MVTADWWQKEMDLLERIVAEVPCYTMRFDKSGAIVAELEKTGPVSEYVRRVTQPAMQLALAPAPASISS